MKKVYLLPLFIFCFFISKSQNNYDGSTDSSFGKFGSIKINDGQFYALKSAILPNGKIITAGYQNYKYITGYLMLMRFKPDGKPDKSYGVDGIVRYNPDSPRSYVAYGMLMLPDNKIIIAGSQTDYQSGITKGLLVRFKPNGETDSSFGVNGSVLTNYAFVQTYFTDITLQENKLLVSGYAGTTPGDTKQMLAARFNMDGSIDPSFGYAGNGIVAFKIKPAGFYHSTYQVLIKPNNDFFIAGYIRDSTGSLSTGYAATVTAFKNNGRFDSNYANNATAIFPKSGYYLSFGQAVLQPDNKIIIGIGFRENGASTSILPLLMRITENGLPDETFGKKGLVYDLSFYGSASSLAVQPDKKIIVTGNYDRDRGDYDPFYIKRYYANGKIDSSFGTNGMTTAEIAFHRASPYHVLLQPDNKIIVTGHGFTGGLGGLNFLSRFNNSSSVQNKIYQNTITLKAVPNPVINERLQLTVSNNRAQRINIVLRNINGSFIKQLDNSYYNAGIFIKEFILPAGLQKGNYFIEARSINAATSVNIVVQ